MQRTIPTIGQTQYASSALAGASQITSTLKHSNAPMKLSSTLPIQLKLTVGATDDPLEHQADAMADKVMRMPETPFIQRCSCGGRDDERVQLKPILNSITPFIQAKSDNGGIVSDSVSTRIKTSMGGGSAMNPSTRSFMESRFGANFSGVKIHSGDESTQLNRSLNARAFTIGNNIFFNQGQYQPETDSGKHLLAHELTHVVQQDGNKRQTGNNPGSNVSRKPTADLIQRFTGCTDAQNETIREALVRARRRSTRAIQIIADIQAGTNPRARATLAHYFGALTDAQVTTVHDRMVVADGRLSNNTLWRCDTGATFAQCGAPDNWCAGTNCPDAASITHLCPPIFQPESDHACAEPSRALIFEHEALRAAGACGGFLPPGDLTPPGSLTNVYSYTRFMFSVATASA